MPNIIFRATPGDLAALATIADAVRRGRPFINRTAAIRYALQATADHLRAQAANAEAAQGRDS